MIEVIISVERPFKSLANEKLVELIKSSKEEKQLQLYHSEFYHRYAPYIYRGAIEKFKSEPNVAVMAEEVVQETFIIASKKITAFSFPEETNSITSTYILKAWLGRIANIAARRVMATHNGFKFDEIKEQVDEEEVDTQLIYIVNDEEEVEVPSEQKLKLRSTLDELSEKQRDIILAYASEGCIDSGRHLSEEAMNFLCSVYKTNPDNIRQIKKRALDKIKAKCSI